MIETITLFELDSRDKIRTLIRVFNDYFLLVIRKHRPNGVSSQALADAKIIHQMIFSKLLHIEKLVEGVNINLKGSGRTIIDPMIIASLVRGVYETVCLFHLVYTLPDSEEKHNLVYLLWKSAGLKHRQKFIPTVDAAIEKLKDNQEEVRKVKSQLENERKECEKIKKKIESSDLFKSLSEKSQKQIHTQLKQKDYKVRFDNLDVKPLSWQEVSETMNLKNDLFGGIYTYFSFYAHPSHISVNQFNDIYLEGGKAAKSLLAQNMRHFFTLISIFVADYIKLFPEVMEIYKSQTPENQSILDFLNVLMRGADFTIRNSTNR